MDLDTLYTAARAAWPGVELPRDAFEQWLRGRDAERATELYLACACTRGDANAMKALEAKYFGALAAAVGTLGALDDVKQELRRRLFIGVDGGKPKLAEYKGRGGLERWLRAVATRVALNLKRGEHDSRKAALDDDDLLGAPLGSEDPELAHMKSLYRGEFKRAFADAMAALDADGQNWLRLYYLDGLGLAELSGLFRVSVPTASRRLAKAREDALEATRKLLRERLSCSKEDLESIMRLIQSRLTIQ